MKKNLILCLAVISTVSFAACGGSGGGAAPAPTPTEFTEFTTTEKIYLAEAITLPNYALEPIVGGSGSLNLKSLSFKADMPGVCSSGSVDVNESSGIATYTDCQLEDHAEYTVDGTITVSEPGDDRSIEYNLTGALVYESNTYDITLVGHVVLIDDDMYMDYSITASGVTYYVTGKATLSGSSITGPMDIAFNSLYARCDINDLDTSTMTFAEIMEEYDTEDCSDATEDSVFDMAEATKAAVGIGAGNAIFAAASGSDGGANPCESGSVSGESGSIIFDTCVFYYMGEMYTIEGTITGGAEGGVVTYNFDNDVSVEYGGTEYELNFGGPETLTDGEAGFDTITADVVFGFSSGNIDFDSDGFTRAEDTGLLNGVWSISADTDGACTLTDFDSVSATIYDFQDFFLSSACVAAE